MSAPEVAESSRAAGKQAEQEPESEPQPRREWVALVSAAVFLGNKDEKPDLALDLDFPPRPSYLVLNTRISLYPTQNDGPMSAYILATDDRSGRILLQFLKGNRPDFFLCDTHRGTVNLLPPVTSYIRAQGISIRPYHSVGLIADRYNPGDYLVVHLHPSTHKDQAEKLLCYSTAKGRWFIRDLTHHRGHMRNPFSHNGVLAHDGCLWWPAPAYGVFFCDPFVRPLELRFLSLPDDCEMGSDTAAFDFRSTLIEQRRCIRLSEGKLRFVEIRGLSYDKVVAEAPANPTVRMWTLDNPWTLDTPEGPTNPWTFEYEVAFAEIWGSKTYADEGLLPGKVPHVAFVDPNDHHVVYFFEDSKLLGLDMREKKVVACEECPIDRDQLEFRSSRSGPLVDAWFLPPPPPTLLDEDVLRSPYDIWRTESEKMRWFLGTPQPPIQEGCGLFKRCTGHGENQHPGRTIRYVRADNDGNYDDEAWLEFVFNDNSVANLRAQIENYEYDKNISFGMMDGMNAHVIPLGSNLPNDENPMQIIVYTTGSPAANRISAAMPSASSATAVSRPRLETDWLIAGTCVRLRSWSGMYLQADKNGLDVSLTWERFSLNTAWRVEPVRYRHLCGEYVTLQGAAYGRYLAVSPTAQGCPRLQQKIFYGELENVDAAWLPLTLPGGASNEVLMRHCRYSEWCLAVTIKNPHDERNIRWFIEKIPWRVQHPVLPYSENTKPLVSRRSFTRTIIYAREEINGMIDSKSWRSTAFRGRSVLNLRAMLARLLGELNSSELILYAWTGQRAPRIPLVVDLPMNNTVMVIGVLNTKSSAAAGLRYPQFDQPPPEP